MTVCERAGLNTLLEIAAKISCDLFDFALSFQLVTFFLSL